MRACKLVCLAAWVLMVGVSGYAQSSDVLPAPLYFIRDNDQIWRLETDGETLTQITYEEWPILGFDVSSRDGDLVYINNFDLVRTDDYGNGREVLFEGSKSPPDEPEYLQLWQLSEDILYPRWSPDGTRIAFAKGGVNIIASDGGEPELLLPSIVPEDNDPTIAFLGSTNYQPIAWSPDGTRLLVRVLIPPESGGLAILNLVDNSLIPITDDDSGSLTCCYPSWSEDSAYVYYSVANQFFTPGLWRADVSTGEGVTLIEGIDEDGTYMLVAYPRQLSDGMLYSFATMTDEPDLNNTMPLTMYRSAPDGSNLEALRNDEHFLAIVLWVENSSGAVIGSQNEGFKYPSTSLLWLPADGSPAVDLNVSGYNLRWGVN